MVFQTIWQKTKFTIKINFFRFVKYLREGQVGWTTRVHWAIIKII